MDAFEQFVFHDATKRFGLNAREASAKVDFHRSWIHHAIVRLRCTESDAEARAVELEIEQDIHNIEARRGWNGQMISAFRERRKGVLPRYPGALPAKISEPAGSPQQSPLQVHRPRWLAWLRN